LEIGLDYLPKYTVILLLLLLLIIIMIYTEKVTEQIDLGPPT